MVPFGSVQRDVVAIATASVSTVFGAVSLDVVQRGLDARRDGRAIARIPDLCSKQIELYWEVAKMLQKRTAIGWSG